MKHFLAACTRLLAVLLLPFVIGLSAQVAAVDVFPVCDGTVVKGGDGTDLCKNVGTPVRQARIRSSMPSESR